MTRPTERPRFSGSAKWATYGTMSWGVMQIKPRK